MSANIDPVFQTAFDAEVKRAYGQVGKIRPFVRVKTNVEGKEIYFRKKAKGLATQHIKGQNVNAMNVAYSQVLCSLADWEAFDYVDKLDLKKFNFDEAKESAEVAGDALGLRLDQIIIDAIAAGYDSTNMKVGTSGAALTVAILISGVAKIDDTGCPSDGRIFLHTTKQKQNLLSTTEVTSSDYNSVKALVNGTVDTFLGLKFVHIASRDEGGLPTANSGADRMGFIVHKDAVGLALGQEIQTSMDWVAEKQAWLVGGSFSAGACVIDDDGIVGVVSVI